MMIDTRPEETTAPAPAGPRSARAVFSTEDFRLMRAAVVHYLKQPEVQDGPESVKYSNLYHRLGRLG